MRIRNAATLLCAMASLLAVAGGASASHCGAASYSSCCQPASDAQCCYPSAAQQMKVCYKLVHDTVINDYDQTSAIMLDNFTLAVVTSPTLPFSDDFNRADLEEK